MSPRTRKILFGVMLVWFVGLFLLWRWTGEVPEPARDTRLRDAVAPVAPAPPPVPEPQPAPVPPAPSDPLAGYLPCSGTGRGQGSFGNLDGHYDDLGRFVLFMTFSGKPGAVSQNESLHLPSRNVVYMDFQGDIPFSQESVRPSGGPVERVRLGRHRGFTRVSVNFRAREAPDRVRTEILCREGSVAVRLAWGDAMSSPVLTGAAPESGPASAPDSGTSGPGPAPGVLSGVGVPAPEPEVPGASLQSALPPVGPSGGPTAVPPARIPADGAGSPEGDVPGGGSMSPAEGASGEGIGAPAACGEASAPCRGTGVGRGSFGPPEFSWDGDARVFTARLPLTSEEGPGEVKIGNGLGRRRGSVSYLDFMGTYSFRKADFVPGDGPFKLLRFGRHQGLVRLGFNYKDGRSPAEPPRTEIRCLQNAVEVKFSFRPAEAEPSAGPEVPGALAAGPSATAPESPEASPAGPAAAASVAPGETAPLPPGQADPTTADHASNPGELQPLPPVSALELQADILSPPPAEPAAPRADDILSPPPAEPAAPRADGILSPPPAEPAAPRADDIHSAPPAEPPAPRAH
ncbi:MAG: hypothetical protein LBQ79_10625, partial [Deltaproteobacteria bacterium]|nr:hypothetical protein [Deltaproteobacteria bacterium]